MDLKKTFLKQLNGNTDLAVDAIGTFSNIRHHLQLAMLDQLKEVVAPQGLGTDWFSTGISLAETALQSQRQLEQELVTRLQKLIQIQPDLDVHEEMTARHIDQAPALVEPAWRPALPQGQGLHLTVAQKKGQIKLPITLTNHLETGQVISVTAVPIEDADSLAIPPHRLAVHPTQLSLDGKSSGPVYILIDMGPEFVIGQDYHAEIRIGGFDPRVLPLRLSIVKLKKKRAAKVKKS